jgi:hypothetical protein
MRAAMDGYEKAGCIFEIFWDEPVLIQPSGQGGTNWSPMPYDPDTGYFYVPGTDSNEFVLARSQPIYHRSTLYKWHPGTAYRLAFGRYLHCDR